jgi:hypothetical protein
LFQVHINNGKIDLKYSMRAKSVNFERGKDPIDSMKVGLGSKKYIPEMEEILSELGFKFKSWEADKFGTHIRWDIHGPLREGDYYEIAWLGEGALKNPQDYGYYLSENRDMKRDKLPKEGFSKTPFPIIDKIMEYEMEDFDETLREKRTEYSLIEFEIERMEIFRNKVNEYKNES